MERRSADVSSASPTELATLMIDSKKKKRVAGTASPTSQLRISRTQRWTVDTSREKKTKRRSEMIWIKFVMIQMWFGNELGNLESNLD
jgi:hypothetical protein